MEIIDQLATLKKSIDRTNRLVEELLISLKEQKLKVENKEKKILLLKEEVSNNIDKIDKIIDNHNANS